MDVYTPVSSSKTTKSSKPNGSMTAKMCNCPVCNKVMRIDTVVLHCTRVHKKELIASMFKGDKDTILKHKIPYVVGSHGVDSRPLEGCLHCGKGYTENAKQKKKINITSRILQLKKDHADCMKHWADYEPLYTGCTGPLVPLPYRMERMERGSVKDVKPVEVVPIVSGSGGFGDEEKALIQSILDILDPPQEGWDDEDDDEEKEPETLKSLLSTIMEKAKSSSKVEKKLRDSLTKEQDKVIRLQEKVEALEEQLEAAKEAVPSTKPSLPAEVADLQELLAEAKEREAGFKEEVETLRSQLFAANMNSQTIPTLEISEKNEELQAKIEELQEAYETLRVGALEREAELVGEIEGMIARGTVETSLLAPLNKLFCLDTENQAVEDPTVNMMVRGVMTMTKEALLQMEKDQVAKRQLESRIHKLEALISRDFD